MTAFALPAVAQDDTSATTSAAANRQTQQAPASIAVPSTPSVPTINPPTKAKADPMAQMMADVAKYEKFDKLMAQGQSSNLPGTYDSVLQDYDGWRSWLYDNDLYVKGQNLSSIGYDVAGGRSPTKPQVFNGQQVTLSNSFEARISWKVNGNGNDIGQFNASFDFDRVSWTSAGPDYVGIDRLDYYQSLFNRKVEIDAGIGANIVNFIGIFSGGNLLLANGLAATIPLEVGMSGGSAVTPLINIQLNGDNGFYSKSGVQRSIRPEGAIVETTYNDGGFRFLEPGAKPLLIQEFGIQRPASPDDRQVWLRAGTIYNFTKYARLDGQGSAQNWAAYALADYQIYKPSRLAPYRGVYIGASAIVSPGLLNVYKQTFEARVYAVGMIPNRPTDALNLTIDLDPFSDTARRTYSALGLQTHKSQFAVGLLYAMHLTRGLYLTPTVSYTRNPSFVGNFGPAVTVGSTFTVLF